MLQQYTDVKTLKRFVVDEIIQAFGLPVSGWARKFVEPVFGLATHRFCELAATFDYYASQWGVCEAARWVLPRFVRQVETRGAEAIPSEGPLLIAANHPGTYDSLVILAQIARRDLKIVASGLPFIRGLPSTAQYLIYVTRLDIHARMSVIRSAIRHLKEGGALLIFPGGKVDPDPGVMPGADEALERWSPSLEVILRTAPQTRVLIAVVSDVLSADWLRHPITRLKKETRDRQLLAEIFQVVQQMTFPQSLLLTPSISFGRPLTTAELCGESDSARILNRIIEQAKALLAEHTKRDLRVLRTLQEKTA